MYVFRSVLYHFRIHNHFGAQVELNDFHGTLIPKFSHIHFIHMYVRNLFTNDTTQFTHAKCKCKMLDILRHTNYESISICKQYVFVGQTKSKENVHLSLDLKGYIYM